MRFEVEVPDGINEVQALQVELLRRVRFNACEGALVAESLLEHRGLWRSFITTDRCAVRLRDISEYPWVEPVGCWNADTLLIQVVPGREAELEALARTVWEADEVSRIGQSQWSDAMKVSDGRYWLGGGGGGGVLRVWWD